MLHQNGHLDLWALPPQWGVSPQKESPKLFCKLLMIFIIIIIIIIIIIVVIIII
jgi:hypothetical protein